MTHQHHQPVLSLSAALSAQPGLHAASDYCFKSRCPSSAVLIPYQALAAYSNLATITDRYTMCKVLSFMPCARKVRSAYIVCVQS